MNEFLARTATASRRRGEIGSITKPVMGSISADDDEVPSMFRPAAHVADERPRRQGKFWRRRIFVGISAIIVAVTAVSRLDELRSRNRNLEAPAIATATSSRGKMIPEANEGLSDRAPNFPAPNDGKKLTKNDQLLNRLKAWMKAQESH
jgi:hypothetical protein